MKAITILIILSFALFSSCKKYDQDEKRSWQTVKKRIVNHWDIVKLTSQYEGSPILEEDFSRIEISFEENGDYIWQYWLSNGQINTTLGTWELSEGKSHLIIRDQNGELLDVHIIERLEKGECTISTADTWPQTTYELVSI